MGEGALGYRIKDMWHCTSVFLLPHPSSFLMLFCVMVVIQRIIG